MAQAIASPVKQETPARTPRKPAPLIVLSTAELAPARARSSANATTTATEPLRQVGTVTGVEVRGPVEGRTSRS